MEMTYDRLNADDLMGATRTDYLVAIDAQFRLVDGDVTIYDEPAFPVVELARSLLIWLEDPGREDFEFDSMSYEEVGSVAIRQVATGWEFGSIFASGTVATPVEWAEVVRCCGNFIARVRVDLVTLGLDPDKVLRR
jgi:hypothetical protein